VLGSWRRNGSASTAWGVNVWLGGWWFTVVGILEPLELAPEFDRAALIGLPIAKQLFDADGSASTIYVRAQPDDLDDVRSVLAATANPEHPEEVEVSRPSERSRRGRPRRRRSRRSSSASARSPSSSTGSGSRT
jgi:putative ABC transport system permease protein